MPKQITAGHFAFGDCTERRPCSALRQRSSHEGNQCSISTVIALVKKVVSVEDAPIGMLRQEDKYAQKFLVLCAMENRFYGT